MNRSPMLLAASLALLPACAVTAARSAYNGYTDEVAYWLRQHPGHAGDRFTERFAEPLAQTTCRDCSLLHYAAAGGSLDIARMLLAAGADPNAVDGDGQTPLHWACATQQLDLARALLEHGGRPSVSVRSAAGLTPLLIAVSATATRSVPVSFYKGVVVFASQSAFPPPDLAQLLLDAGADTSARMPKSGNTALHVAAERGDAAMVRLLLSHGADRAARNAAGLTPLALAERGDIRATAAVLRDAVAR